MGNPIENRKLIEMVNEAATLCDSVFRNAPDIRLPGDRFAVKDVGRFNRLDTNVKECVMNVAKFLIVESFGQDSNSPNFISDVMHFLSGGHLYLIINHSIPVALRKYKIAKIYSHRGLLLMSSVTHPDYQKLGIMSSIIDQLIQNSKPEFIAIRTQNPICYQILMEFARECFPGITPTIHTPRIIKKIAEGVAQAFGSTCFNIDTFVDAGTYGEAVYAKPLKPRSKYDDINKLFDSKLNYDRGDSLIIIGLIGLKEKR